MLLDPPPPEHEAFLARLGFRDHEHIAVCIRDERPFRSRVYRADEVAAVLAACTQLDTWISAQPVSVPLLSTRRGSSADVTRIAHLYADLDYDEGKVPDTATGFDIIDGLSDVLGYPPSVVVASGHGLQPWWVMAPEPRSTLASRARALRKWGSTVTRIAASHGAGVDNVFDLPRVLRVPGTTNRKQPDRPARTEIACYPTAPTTPKPTSSPGTSS